MLKFILCAVAVVACCDISIGQLGAADTTPETRMADAAKQAYSATEAAYQAGTIQGIDQLYIWSRRWMEAELKLAAAPGEQRKVYMAHLERMKALNRETAAKFNMGAVGGEAEKFHASEYYLAEAEMWMKNAKPANIAAPDQKVRKD